VLEPPLIRDVRVMVMAPTAMRQQVASAVAGDVCPAGCFRWGADRRDVRGHEKVTWPLTRDWAGDRMPAGM
jgi:hypothetical protein